MTHAAETAQPDNSRGSMIALYPPPELAEALALPGGEPIASIHLTIAYTGKAATVDREALEAAAQALAYRDPVDAVISGHARFTGGPQDVHVALADSAQIEDLRRDALDRLSANGIAVPREHGYTAHLTRSYAEPDDTGPGRLDAVPVTFTAVSAVHGGVRTDYPFTGSPLAPVAAEAFTAGWVIARGPATPRLAETRAAAVLAACAREHDPQVIEDTITAGHLEGTRALLTARREKLAARHAKTVIAAWNSCVHTLNMRRLISRYRSDVFLPDARHVHDQPGESAGPQATLNRELAIAAALGLLRGIYQARAYPALDAAVEELIRAGMAEGKAAALALAASRQGHTGFDIQAAYDAAYDDLYADPRVDTMTAGTIDRMIDGAGNDLGRALAARTDPDSGYDGMLTAAWGAIGGDQARAPSVFSGWATWAAIGAGILGLYQLAGVGTVTWTADGPDPCQQCITNASNSPYQSWAVPAYPCHPRCMCELGTTDLIDPALMATFLPGR